jgi:hypothetical protein
VSVAPSTAHRLCRACGDPVRSPSYRLCERCVGTRCNLCRLPVAAHHVACPARPPRRCEHCHGAEGLASGARFCEACRAQRCSNCQRVGRHHPDCYRAVVRLCASCGAAPRAYQELCASCHERNLCPTCGRRWKTHPHVHPPARVRAAFVGAVTAAELEQVYCETWGAAVGRAAQIVGAANAPDAVQNAVIGLLKRRDYLRPPATSGLFMRRVIWEALVFKRQGKITLVCVDPLDLEGLERQQWHLEHGARAEAQ